VKGKQFVWTMVFAAVTAVGLGCEGITSTQFNRSERLDRGLVLLLPGIEGEGPLSWAVRQGLDDAGVDEALSIYRWHWPIPVAGLVLNQIDFIRARRKGHKVADYIVKYQDRHPGKPVHIVGHSGGGAIAVFAAESLPDKRHKIDGIILLSPSLSSGYDLSAALANTRKGIVNYWSPGDFALLVLGTMVFGNLDGVHGSAAGATGFTKTPVAGKLYQIPWTEAMVAVGNRGGHMDTTKKPFVVQWVAPWIRAPGWPVDTSGGPTSIPATQACDGK